MHRVNKIIPAKLDLLVQLTQHQSGVLRDFEFLVQSFWLEVVEKFEENLSFIFSAGDPEKFHSHYTTMFAWLDDFERRLGDVKAIEKFRSNPSYSGFTSRWNLSIYFQIRQQEIAMPVELAVEDMFEKGSGGKYHLASTEVVLSSIRQCWDPSIFLVALTNRFWKMTLQILARYTKAASKVLTQKVSEAGSSMTHEAKMKASATTVALVSGAQQSRMSHSRSASDQGSLIGNRPVPGVSQMTTFETSEQILSEDELLSGLVSLYLDIVSLSGEQSYILNEMVLPSLPASISEHSHLLTESLDEGFQVLTAQSEPLVRRLVDIITARCIPFLKQVSDIPRLYRRTNRELPSKACTYMTSLLAPIQTFHSVYCKVVTPSDVINGWLVQMFIRVCDQYLFNVSDVLAAVQKMEESLQRLKKVRGGVSLNAGGPESRAGGMSDDDKIRLQLFVDVQHLIDTMEAIGVQRNQVPAVIEVDNLVKEATKACYDDYLAKMSTVS